MRVILSGPWLARYVRTPSAPRAATEWPSEGGARMPTLRIAALADAPPPRTGRRLARLRLYPRSRGRNIADPCDLRHLRPAFIPSADGRVAPQARTSDCAQRPLCRKHVG